MYLNKALTILHQKMRPKQKELYLPTNVKILDRTITKILVILNDHVPKPCKIPYSRKYTFHNRPINSEIGNGHAGLNT